MRHNDDAFATMLLMSQLSADKEELVHPLSVGEYNDLRRAALRSGMPGLGALIGIDLNALQRQLQLSAEEAYRVCVLLNRVMPLSYALEQFSNGGIDIVTIDEAPYPQKLAEKLADKAPPMLYTCGDLSLPGQCAAAILSNTCADKSVLECAVELSNALLGADVTLVTGGEVGFGRLMEREALHAGGRVISFLAESMTERVYQPGLSEMIATQRGLVMSIVHPEAKYTAAHALERNKCLYALGDACFVLSCEKNRGVTWNGACQALRNRYSERVYVWENPHISGNMDLIAKGATPFRSPHDLDFEQLRRIWVAPQYEQMTLF
ncbi:MAG: DNA-processing protein DprA [Clostridia bacterium]|nr:DNA-processing protein DprA [Clostridia bacterium]